MMNELIADKYNFMKATFYQQCSEDTVTCRVLFKTLH